MTRARLAFLACVSLGLAACRPKELSYEEKIALSIKKAGLEAPEATGATVPVFEDGVMVLFFRDKLDLDSPKSFTLHADPQMAAGAGGNTVLRFDARAATEGADAKYKRTPADPYVVPLANALQSYLSNGTAKRMMIVSAGPPPPQLLKEVVATFAEQGVTDAYRIVRTKDGKVAAERLAR